MIPLILFGIMCLIPFMVLISSSLTSNDVLTDSIQIFPKDITFEAYRYIFMFPQTLLTSYALTIGVTVIGTLLNLLLCMLIAYPLADMKYKYRRIVSFLLFFTMLFSAGLIPTYIIIRRVLMLYDSFLILILYPLLAPSHVFFLRIFYQTVPVSLYESAKMDGADEYTILFRIGTPVILPGIATIVFQFILMYWNDAFTALNFTDGYYPVALYIQRWQTYIDFLKRAGTGGVSSGGQLGGADSIPDITVRFAMGVVSSLPLVIIFLFCQKYFVRGLVAGAVKG